MASSTVTNSKYLDYAGLSHLKTVLDSRYTSITRSFITNRDTIDNLTPAQITSYADLSTSSAGQSAFKLLKSGSYNVARSGSSELLINLGTTGGSVSALEFLTNYTHTSRLKIRKIVDSNRVSGEFKELAWYSDIPTKVSQLTNDAGYTTASGHTHSSIVSKDIRSLTGVTSDFSDKTFTPFFSNVSMPTTNWWSGFTSKGWTNDYNSWQLVGYSAQSDASALDLYWRNGVNDAWNTWKKILDTSNTTYTASVTSSTSGAYQIGTLKIGDTDTILYGKNTTYSSLKNPYSLIIQANGTTLTNGTYDGSAEKTVNITAASIDAATSGHTHTQYSPSNHTHSYVASAGYAATSGRSIYSASSAYAATAYNISTSNLVTNETINTLTNTTVTTVPNIATTQIVNSGALRQFWVNVRNIIEDNEFVCAAALTDLNTRFDNINTSISLASPVSTTKYNILGSLSTSGEINTAYCNSSVYMMGNNLYATSDARLKDFKEDIEVDLEKLRKLPKKYFTWKGESMMDLGTSAQELLKLYPELVSYDSVNDIYAVDYVKLSVIALAAVDTLYDRLKATEDRLKAIEDKLAKFN